MKKMYILGLASMFVLGATAQNRVQVKSLKKSESSVNAKLGNNGGSSISQIAGNLVCTTPYVAGTTMDLNFELTLTNTDFEYGDYLEITFPAGITPNSSPNDPFASDAADPGPDGPEALNPIVGQVISWGNNDDNWGGIVADGTTYPFTVNVTIAPGTTGNLPANYVLSGDQYTGPAPDQTGSITIFEAGASIDDVQAFLGGAQTLTNCNNGMLDVAVRIKNLGTTTVSGFPVSYKINALPAVTETVSATLAPGDSTDYVFTAQGDFSAEGVYAVKVYTGLVGDAVNSNDTINQSFYNGVSVDLSTTPYANGIETSAEVAQLTVAANPGTVANWGLSTVTFQSGVQALFLTGSSAIADSWVFTKCLDVTAGETYRVTYWTRTNTGFNGGMSVSVGATNSAAGMTAGTEIKAFTANTADATWRKDSADYTPSASGTVYFGFRGQGTAAGSGTNVRLDNINIFKTTTVGVSELATSNEVSIFPNPSTGIFTVKALDNNSTVEVYNIVGERMLSSKLVNGNNTINMSNMSVGTYFFKVTSNGEVTTKKVVLSK